MSLEAAYPLMEAPLAEAPPATDLGSLVQDSAEPPLSEELPGERRRRLIATTLSVLIHALLLVLIIWLATIPLPVNVNPIPVQIVNQLPPNAPPMPQSAPKPPAPKQPQPPKPKQEAQKPPPPPPPKPKEQPRQPRERLASADLGNPNAPKDSVLQSELPASGPAVPDEGTEQSHDTGAAALANPDDAPSAGTLGDKSDQPKQVREPIKRKGGSKIAMLRDKSSRLAGKYAPNAGEPARYNAYIAYVQRRILMNRGMLNPSLIQGVNKTVCVVMRILPSGHIAAVAVNPPSGRPDLDSILVQMVYKADQLPPVPPELVDNPDLPLVLGWKAYEPRSQNAILLECPD